jgi:hypothetical protein
MRWSSARCFRADAYGMIGASQLPYLRPLPDLVEYLL